MQSTNQNSLQLPLTYSKRGKKIKQTLQSTNQNSLQLPLTYSKRGKKIKQTVQSTNQNSLQLTLTYSKRGKKSRAQARCDWFWFCLSLVEKLAILSVTIAIAQSLSTVIENDLNRKETSFHTPTSELLFLFQQSGLTLLCSSARILA